MSPPLQGLALGLLALAAGALHALSFAPWERPWLQVLALALLFALTTHIQRPRAAALLGFLFGLGWFGIGVSWVYISMHVYGQMPALLAGAATAAFCAFLALYPALALGVAQRMARAPFLRLALALPATWALSEWLRGTLFTGFPWLASGYAHTDGPLAGFAPVLGVYGIGFVAALLAGALAIFTLPLRQRGVRGYVWAAGMLALALVGGTLIGQQRWTQPIGAPLKVRLVQANIPQDAKFTTEGLRRAFDEHWALMQGPRVDLIALPESVFPVPLGFVPGEALDAFRSFAREYDSGLIFGVFIEDPPLAYYNSAVGLAPAATAWQRYSKQHLVPFGEFIPWGFRWFVDLMQMPIGDQERGAVDQPPMAIGGQRIAVNICYEDLFGHVIRRAWHDPANAPTMMLNLSNLAWFEDSIALPQHLQISRMRTLETQHPMLRATNTGATAIVDAWGRVAAQLPFNTAGALDGTAQGQHGLTPYIRYGNAPALLIGAIVLLFAAAVARAGRRRSAQ
jgi:apolipoprotein N-acyltransferase